MQISKKNAIIFAGKKILNREGKEKMLRKRSKEIKGFILGLIFAAVLSGTVVAASPVMREIVFGVSVTMNGVPVNFPADAQPFIMNDRTYLPVRTVANLAGLQVSFVDGVVNLTGGDFAVSSEPGPGGDADEAPPVETEVSPVETTVTTATLNVSETNVSGAAAIPVAYDVYRQFEALFATGPGVQSGFDADMMMEMVMEFDMDGVAGTQTSISTGNMRMNIDGVTAQSATIMDSVYITSMEFAGIPIEDATEMQIEMFMEIDDEEITFFQMIMDGEIFDDPAMASMMNLDVSSMSMMNIPDFTIDAILAAEISEVGNNIHVAIALDAEMLSDFIDEMFGNIMDEMFEAMDMDMDITMEIDNLDFVIVLDNTGNLLGMNMDMGMAIAMSMSYDGEDVEMTMYATSTTFFIYNHIGNVAITMPAR